MIEKLEKQNTWGECLEKLNEVIDAVNVLQLAKDVMFNRIDRLNDAMCDMRKRITALEDSTYHKAENSQSAKIAQDPYAEQRKWIGCVCRFWYDNPDDTVLDYLGKIQTGENGIEYYGKETYDWFPHCEPVKPDDDIIYKGE